MKEIYEASYTNGVIWMMNSHLDFLEELEDTGLRRKALIGYQIEDLRELMSDEMQATNPEASDKQKAMDAGTYDAVMSEANRQIDFLNDL